MSSDFGIDPPRDTPPDGTRLEVVDGILRAVPGADDSPAELSWAAGTVRVLVDGTAVDAASCRVARDATVRIEPVHEPARNRYVVSISRDRMQATLRIAAEAGCRRTLRDHPASASLRLAVEEVRVEPDAPTVSEASAELQAAGVVHGIDADAVAAAVEDPGSEHVVAIGLDAVEGRNGYIEDLVDFAALGRVGVLADTPLLRRVRKRDGIAGRDVTGRDLAVPAVKDVRIRPGEGVVVDDKGIMAVAAVDGAPWRDGDGNVEVRHELVLGVVDAASGDISFNGSIRVEGDVGEGRTVVARDELVVEGSVDRARLESGGLLRVDGTIMSSVLRAGGERAVAATIADRVLGLPRALGVVAAQARQLRDSAAAKGTELSHGLSVQLVLERIHRRVLTDLGSVVEDLREAGPAHSAATDRASRWLRLLSTAANVSLTTEQLQEIVVEVGALASDVQRACEQPADLVVSYVQASEAEATGTVTLTGKGIFNSRIVALGGMEAEQYDAVFRGGAIVSHGAVRVREVGSPAGAKTVVQLGVGASLESDRSYAGTVISGPGYTHRFVADRTHVRVGFDGGGTMNVESLAA